MKTRKLSYWIGLLCLAVLILMPDITVNAQTEPGGQGSDEQMPEVVGQDTDTQTSEEQLTSEKQQTSGGQGPSNQGPTKPIEDTQLMIVAEQTLIETGCQLYETISGSASKYDETVVLHIYHCPPSSGFAIWPSSYMVGYQEWNCLVSPDRIVYGAGEEDLRSGECILPRGAGIGGPTENDQPPRQINVKKIAEPASSDSQGESAQQQANSDDADQVDEEAQGEEAQGEEAQGEEDKASNQSQAINNSKQGYGCSANP